MWLGWWFGLFCRVTQCLVVCFGELVWLLLLSIVVGGVFVCGMYFRLLGWCAI